MEFKLPKKAIAVALGILLFAFILSSVNVRAVLSILSSARLLFLFAALCTLVFLLYLKGLKWQLILLSQNTRIGVLRSSKYFCIGFFFSSITPGRIGDFVRSFYVKKEAGLSAGMSSVIIDRIMDVAMLGILATLASALLVWSYNVVVIPVQYLAIGLVAFAAASLFFLKESYVAAALRPLYSAFVPNDLKDRVSSAFRGFYSAIRASKENRLHVIQAAIVTVVFWVFEVAFAYTIALSIGVVMPFYFMLLVYPLLSLADLIPISVSGIGTREAILVVMFSFIGLTKEQAVAFSLMIFLVSYVLVAALGYLFYLSEPVDVKSILGGKTAE